MKKISGSTFIFKRLFPFVWFAILGFFFLSSLMSGSYKKDPAMLIFMIAMCAFGYFVIKRIVGDIVDEAYDNGHELVFRNKGKETRVSLKDITNIDYNHMHNPPKVRIYIRKGVLKETKIVFSPPGAGLFNKHPLVSDLIDRVYIARKYQPVTKPSRLT